MPETDSVEINVTILDKKLRLFLPGDGWNFEEAKIAKSVSEGMSPAQIESALLEGDPDAWMAVLRVSYMRADQDFPSARIQGENIIDLMRELADATREAISQRPPTNRHGSGSAASLEPEESETTELPSSA